MPYFGHAFPAQSISEEFSSGDRDTKPLSKPDMDMDAASSGSSSKSHDKDEETIKVYDGNQGARRKKFRTIQISKSFTTEQMLLSALKAFHITKCTEDFYLTDAYNEETLVSDPNPVGGLKRHEGKRPAVFIRFR